MGQSHDDKQRSSAIPSNNPTDEKFPQSSGNQFPVVGISPASIVRDQAPIDAVGQLRKVVQNYHTNTSWIAKHIGSTPPYVIKIQEFLDGLGEVSDEHPLTYAQLLQVYKILFIDFSESKYLPNNHWRIFNFLNKKDLLSDNTFVEIYESTEETRRKIETLINLLQQDNIIFTSIFMAQIELLVSLCKYENSVDDLVRFATLLRDLKIDAIDARKLFQVNYHPVSFVIGMLDTLKAGGIFSMENCVRILSKSPSKRFFSKASQYCELSSADSFNALKFASADLSEPTKLTTQSITNNPNSLLVEKSSTAPSNNPTDEKFPESSGSQPHVIDISPTSIVRNMRPKDLVGSLRHGIREYTEAPEVIKKFPKIFSSVIKIQEFLNGLGPQVPNHCSLTYAQLLHIYKIISNSDEDYAEHLKSFVNGNYFWEIFNFLNKKMFLSDNTFVIIYDADENKRKK